jgi:hypothetical protein
VEHPKTLLGWQVDTAAMTLALPDHRQVRLAQLLADMSQRHRVSKRWWQQLLGELCSMALALAGAKFHFSLLQHALTTKQKRVRITSLLRQALNDWRTLLPQVSTPMSLHSVVPCAPDVIAGCDTSLHGLGGWLWNPLSPNTIYIWRHPFPTHIQ